MEEIFEQVKQSLEKKQDYFIETDVLFIHEIKEIVAKKNADNPQNVNISDETCEKIMKLACLHTRANVFNCSSMMDATEMQEKQIESCKCGCKRGVGENLPLCLNEQNFSFLGSGVLLFFFYLKYLRITIALLFVGYGCFALLANIFSDRSEDMSSCYKDENLVLESWICQINILSSFDRTTSLFQRLFKLTLGSIIFIVWFITIKFIAFLGEKKNQEIDDLLQTSSDFTIMVQNLPSGHYEEEQLIDYLMELWCVQQSPNDQAQISMRDILELKSIQIIYSMKQCRELIKNIQNKSSEIDILLAGQKIKQGKEEEFFEKKVQFHEFLKELSILRDEFKTNGKFRSRISTTASLIEFKKEEQQRMFLRCFGEKKSRNLFEDCFQEEGNFMFKGKQIRIRRAPEPSDILWANCEIQWSYIRYILIWLITVLILYASYAFISYSITLQFVKKLEGFLVSVILQIFNRIIWMVLSFLVSYEYHNTKTEQIISLMKKSIFAQIINVIIIPIFVKFFNQRPLYGEGSLASTMLTYQFIMFFMMTIFNLLNPGYYLKKILLGITCSRNWIIRSKCQVVGEIDTFSQIKPVFQFYEGAQFPIAGAYVYLITATFLTLFYCHLQPLILFILIFNISGFALILKYLLLRRNKIPGLTNVQIFDFAIFTMSGGTAFYAIGSLFFLLLQHFEKYNNFDQFPYSELIPSSVCLLLWIIFNINPNGINEKISEALFKEFKFDENFFQLGKEKQGQNGKFMFELVTKAMEEANIAFKRRQSYYSESNANKLLNFEFQLQEIHEQKKINKHKQFCQYFFRKNRPMSSISKGRSKRFSGEFDTILIPVELDKKKQQKGKRIRQTKDITQMSKFLPRVNSNGTDDSILKSSSTRKRKQDQLKIKFKESNPNEVIDFIHEP